MSESVGNLGEDGLVADVLARYAPAPPFVRVGPGDDAAVLDVDGQVVVSTDTLVEGHDFRRDWSSGHDVGVKTAAQNLADVCAMGARPLALLVSLSTPSQLPARWARDLADGLQAECRRAGAAVVGGDVSAATAVVVTGTAVGVLHGPAVLRSGARPGDVVALAGRTGLSAAGLALLSATVDGASPSGGHDRLVAAHRAPQPAYEDGPAAARAGASALIDTSDGLLRDAARIAAASGVDLDLDGAALAPGPDLVAAASALGRAELAALWVLTGGEDHAFLACFPPDADLPPAFTRIGAVLPAGPPAGPGNRDVSGQVLVDGRAWSGPTGWRHFG